MGLVSELRRRSVFRMAVLYLGAAWLVLQVVDLLIDRGPLPVATGPWILAVLVIGFPIALALSWFYELTPEGVTRDDDFRSGTSAPAAGRRVEIGRSTPVCRHELWRGRWLFCRWLNRGNS
jgi:hypothetical protein